MVAGEEHKEGRHLDWLARSLHWHLGAEPAVSSLVKEAGISGVHIGPGATPLTRIPLPTSWRAIPLVKATMAPLVEV